MYKLQLTKLVENPNYESDLIEWRRNREQADRPVGRYDDARSNRMIESREERDSGPKKFVVEKTLEVELTDAEYERVKTAVIQTT